MKSLKGTSLVRSNRRSTSAVLAAIGAGTALFASTPARADSAAFMKLQYGVGGPVSEEGKDLKDAGPGTEQATSTFIKKGGKDYIVTIWMSSDVSSTDRNWQCKCNSVEISSKGPSVVVANEQLTHGGSERPCNHPIASNDGQSVVWVYGSDYHTSQNNVATYAGAVDTMCKTVIPPVRVSDDDNKNEGAPDIAYNGGEVFTSGYLSGGETTYAIGLKVSYSGTPTITRTYKTAVVNPANIGRPMIVAASSTRSLVCAAKGDQRPPEDGVDCAWLDATSGNIMWNDIIAASDPNNHIYMNQPSVALLDFGRIAINVQESNGNGKNTDNQGSNISHLHVIQPSDTGYEEKDVQSGMSPLGYDKHAAICSGQYGTTGNTAIAVMGASPIGVGAPGVQMVTFASDTGLAADKTADFWQTAPYGDSGMLSNIYGENPHDQGRDFLRCVGNFKNPGYGVQGGFMENSETLMVHTVSGRVPGEPKNALFLSFIPGKQAKHSTSQPGAPIDVTQGWNGSSSTSSGSGSGSTGSGSNASGSGGHGSSSGGAGGGDNDEPGGFKQTSSGGCGCSIPGTDDSSGKLALGALALGLIAISRRRREEG